jgi:adenosylcobinamide-phosphate guanylyltransferase
MDGLVMCGGRGRRLNIAAEKPLLTIGGRPMIDRVVDALVASHIGQIYAVTSSHTPETGEHLCQRDVTLIETAGEGYVADLGTALEQVDFPVMTVVADLPLLDTGTLDSVLAQYDEGSLTVCVPVELKRQLGVSVDTTLPAPNEHLTPTGLNVVATPDAPNNTMIRTLPQLAVNVNRRRDAAIAEALL